MKKIIKLAVMQTMVAAGLFFGTTAYAAENDGEVKISETNFHDEGLRNYVKKYDTDKNGYLSDGERKKIKKLKVTWKAKSFTGIEYLTNLREFEVGYDIAFDKNLKEVDFTKNQKLEDVYFSFWTGTGDVKKLDVSGCSELKKITVECAAMENINLKGCNKVEKLKINSKKLKKIDVSDLVNLKVFDIIADNMKQINLKKQHSLKKLYITSKKLTKFDLGNYKSVKSLMLITGSLKNIDSYISKFSNITYFALGDYPKETLKLSGAKQLKKLSELDLYGGTKNKKIIIKDFDKLNGSYIHDDTAESLEIYNCKSLKDMSVFCKKLSNFKLIKSNNIKDLRMSVGEPKKIVKKSKTKVVTQ